MEHLKLPAPLDSVEIPQYLSVSRLADGPCLLHVVAPRTTFPKMPRGPHAELGQVTHGLIELAIRGQLGNRGVPAIVGDAFDYLLHQASTRLSLDPETKRYADLRVAFSKREWQKRRFYAISDAEKVKSPNRAVAKFEEPRGEPFSLEHFLQRGKEAAEVPFESISLRIRGRLDLVSIQDEEITVSDFKTGRVNDLDGHMNEQTSLQLRLYGLAIHELSPARRIALRAVSREGESFERFDEETRIKTSEWLAGITDVLDVGTHMPAIDLAVIGSQCARCDIRPICPAYFGAVGELWKRDDTAFALPLDTAGTVSNVQEHGDGYFSTKMVDLANRTVKIHRLSRERARDVATDQALWFFDLASIEAKLTSIGWRHPRNFHEVAMLPTERTAWTVRVFSSEH